jgi:BA14K-like protein
MRLVLCVCCIIVSAQSATADVPDYCAAYARDHADLGEREKIKWQKRYDNALNNCTVQFSNQDATPAEKKPPKPAIKTPEAKPLPTPKEKPKLTAEPAPPKKLPPVQVLKAGTPEWVKYCKNKYVSFNEATGNYLSKTGVERKCLVTAD